MFLGHIEATHITDYSTVSGLYGPGTFWAWIISCVMAFCPNEGLVLLRHIFLGPILGLEDADILNLPRPQGMAGDSDEIDSEKLEKVRRFLDCIFCLSFLKNKQKSELVTDIAFGFFRGSELELTLWNDYPEDIKTFTPLRPILHVKYERATGARAEMILNLDRRMSKIPSNGQGGFIEYHSRERVDTNGLYYRFFKEISTMFPWLQMEFEDFHHHLIDIRNRFQFLQYRRELRELPPTMNANTWAAIAYPVIACSVQMARHLPFKNRHWEAGDEAVASVALISLMMSALALLSNRSSFNFFTLRHALWMTVYIFSWTFLICRGYFVCVEEAFLDYFVTFQVLGFTVVPLMGLVWFIPRVLLAWCFPARFSKPQQPYISTAQLALTPILVLAMVIVRRPAEPGSDSLCTESSWDLHFSMPIPRSSVSLGELDQAAALATAMFLMISAPLQRRLSSVSFSAINRGMVKFFTLIITWLKEKYIEMKRGFMGSTFEMADNNGIELADQDDARLEEGRNV